MPTNLIRRQIEIWPNVFLRYGGGRRPRFTRSYGDAVPGVFSKVLLVVAGVLVMLVALFLVGRR